MKKNLFLAALAITALVSCSESDYLGDEKQVPVSSGDLRAISFGSGYKAVTRAEFEGKQAADSLRNNFVVMGVKSDGAPTTTCDTVFNHYNVNYGENTSHTTTSNSAGWEYVAQTKEGAYVAYGTSGDQSIKYWDYAKSQYDFIAWSKGGATAVYADGDYTAGTNVQISAINPKTMDDNAYTIKGQAKDLAKVYIADLVTVYRDGANENDAAGKYGQEVDIKFRSLSAKARVGIYETVPGYSVKDVKFYSDAKTLDNDGNAHLYTTGEDVFNNEGTYTVYFPTIGKTNKSDTDYNKAHLKFTADENGTSKGMDFGTLDENTYVNKYNAEKEEQVYIGRSSNEATYAGVDTNGEKHYTTVMPNETGALLNLKVRYTLLSTDGSKETITVDSATAKVPAVYAQWKSGYAYTYLFKISKNSNGWTNPEAGPAGLYPITLDAVVVETTDSVQETITTVAEPSITTYAKGQVVTENNEYLPNSKIYVIVEDNGSVASLTDKAKLYTVTLETGAAQTINEASVANVLVNGTPNSTSEPTSWTVKDKNGKDMVVTAASGLEISTNIAAADAPGGNQIDVNCAYFTPSQNNNDTVYVFQYIKTAPVPDATVYYEEAEVNSTNAALPGALNSTDPLTEEQATNYNTAMSASVAAGGTLTPEQAAAYNATLPGAISTSTVKTPIGGTTPGVYGYKIIRIKR